MQEGTSYVFITISSIADGSFKSFTFTQLFCTILYTYLVYSDQSSAHPFSLLPLLPVSCASSLQASTQYHMSWFCCSVFFVTRCLTRPTRMSTDVQLSTGPGVSQHWLYHWKKWLPLLKWFFTGVAVLGPLFHLWQNIYWLNLAHTLCWELKLLWIHGTHDHVMLIT